MHQQYRRVIARPGIITGSVIEVVNPESVHFDKAAGVLKPGPRKEAGKSLVDLFPARNRSGDRLGCSRI